MKTVTRIAVVALLATTFSGCVYVNGENISSSDWKDEQRTNREAISNLALGSSTAAVMDKLGTPADSEAFTQDDIEVRVLFYRTRHKQSDGETTRDETTPLVFRDDQLIGWGEKVYQDLR